MAIFDNVVGKFDNFKGYEGNPPTTEKEYNALDCWKDSSKKPSWETILTSISLEETRSKRLSEYPTLQECIHAILDDNLEELQNKRQAVKDKYPKGDK